MSDKATGETQRAFSRSSVKVHVKLFCDDAPAPIEGQARDLSMNGVFVPGESRLPEGSSCRIEIDIEHVVHVDATGAVARQTEDGMAITFNEISSMESFEHLQRLVLYNSTDPEQVLTEEKKHSGIR